MSNYIKKLQEFLDNCAIPDGTPIVYKDRVIGHTTGENDCKKPIKAVICPFEVSVDFCGQDFADGIINVHSLSIKADEESSYEIPLRGEDDES